MTMNKYTDVICEEFLENTDISKLDSIFLNLGITTIYVVRYISKNYLSKDFIVPASKKINYKKIYLVNDINDFNKFKKDETDIVMMYGNNLSNISRILQNERVDILLNPISDRLSFDEGSANVAKFNKKIIAFDVNLWRKKTYSSLKQAMFIIPLLKKKKVEMMFISLAKKPSDLVDPRILKALLLEFKLDDDIIERFLEFKIK